MSLALAELLGFTLSKATCLIVIFTSGIQSVMWTPVQCLPPGDS